ncbi:MAG: hypothetical protein WBA43_13860, partial [Elainellaceae cyanobacterium]
MPNLDLEGLKESFDSLSQNSRNADFSQAIEAWIKELNVSKDVRRFIWQQAGNLEQSRTPSALLPRIFSSETNWPIGTIKSIAEALQSAISNLRSLLDKFRPSEYPARARTFDIKKSLFLALLLVIGCFLIHSCFDKSASEDEYARPKESPKSKPSQARNLALVVGANAKDLCEKLGKQRINPEDWQELYAKTQDLVLTNKSLNDLLDLKSESITSEYSVYIVLMTLDPQTNEDSNLIERGFTR